jgi:NADPH2:quinone reductase
MAQTMAARLVRHNEDLDVTRIPVPDPGAEDVELDMCFGGVNPVDRYTIMGRVAPDGPLPRTLGGEGSGLLGGRLVVVHGGGLGSTRDGVYSGVAVVPRHSVVEVPAGVDAQVAAAVGVAGVTAFNVVHLARVEAGDRVVILGAGGGVGLPTMSYAASRGATVWGQVGTGAKAGAVKACGAENVIVGDADDMGEALAAFRPTVVIDPLGAGFTRAALTGLQPHGRYVVFGTSAGGEVSLDWQAVYRKSLTVSGYGGLILTPAQRRAGIAGALGAIAAGEMTIPVDRVLPLAAVNEAFAALADRKITGKVLLDLRD